MQNFQSQYLNTPTDPPFHVESMLDEVVRLLSRPSHLESGMLVRDLRKYFLGSKPWASSAWMFDDVLYILCEQKLIEPVIVISPSGRIGPGTYVGYKVTVDGWIKATADRRLPPPEREVG